MGFSRLSVTRWSGPGSATGIEIQRKLKEDGLFAFQWANGPGDTYAAHKHAYNKVIYVVDGSITFGLPGTGEEVTLTAGDRLDLPAGTMHSAVIGPEGVVCLEAHR